MNGKMSVSLGGEHTFTAADLAEHNFRKKINPPPMNSEPSIWFVETTSGAESHIQCEGKLWIKEHPSFPAALKFAVLQRWLVDDDNVGIQNVNKAIQTNPGELKMLGFRSEGTLFPHVDTAAKGSQTKSPLNTINPWEKGL